MARGKLDNEIKLATNVPGARRWLGKAGFRVFKPGARDARVRYRSWFPAQFIHSLL